MTQPKVNNLPNLASAPKSPQGVSTVAMSQTKVDLIIYSGRSDPNWLLTQVETAELQRLLSHLSTTQPVKDQLYQLGYRGFFANLSYSMSHQPQFFKVLHQANTVQACLIKLAPTGYKPDIFEGGLFVDSYEGVASISNLKISEQNNSAIVTASLNYGTHSWTDRLILHKKADLWLIVDIKYASKKDTLVEILTSYVQQHKSTCKPD